MIKLLPSSFKNSKEIVPNAINKVLISAGKVYFQRNRLIYHIIVCLFFSIYTQLGVLSLYEIEFKEIFHYNFDEYNCISRNIYYFK